ncbi:MAG: carbamoyl-phosphate synthase large subunit, partial [Candidatus Omnitrophica bacterium]|nr:carbamoyl-phosphate synthase large subunit [Candidatus Omnitrophota bacterium]
IGQGIEFDYCCVHASFALKELGYETIMVNSNPETVSTDYDISDRLYFESLTIEDVLNIIDHEKPAGVIVQFGGQTPLNLARSLEQAGAPIIGTSVDSIDRAEDRDRFQQMIRKLGLVQPRNAIATTIEGAKIAAKEIGYPVIVRPSYVLGGRAMEIVYDDISLDKYAREAARVSGKHPILVDQYIEDAYETDVDLVSDGEIAVIGAVMEHIEEAGIHSGDSACVIPPYSLGKEIIDEIRRCTYAMAKELKVVGLMNVQFAVKNNTVYVLEVNPRASRTVPFVSKAIGVPLAKLAAKTMVGVLLQDSGFIKEVGVSHVSVKESVLPFARFPGVDIILGPEMHSTGEVMGIDTDFGKAFAKSQIAAGQPLNIGKNVFVSVMDKDKRTIPAIAKKLVQLGFQLIATKGTAAVLEQSGLQVKQINKLIEGRPHIGDLIRNGEIHLIINTPSGKGPMTDEGKIRALAVSFGIPCITTIAGAQATVKGIETIQKDKLGVKAIQDYHRKAESGKWKVESDRTP